MRIRKIIAECSVVAFAAVCLAQTPAHAQELVFTDVAGAPNRILVPPRYLLRCENDEVLVGVFGRRGAWIDSLGAVCQRVVIAGRHVSGGERSTEKVGGSGGPVLFGVRCPSDHAIVSLNGRVGSYIDIIEAQCRRLSADGSVTGGLVPASSTSSSTVAASSDAPPFGPSPVLRTGPRRP